MDLVVACRAGCPAACAQPAPPPPVVDAAPMDAAAWEAKLDGIVGPGQRYRGAIEPLIDGEAFFTAFVKSESSKGFARKEET